MKIKKVQSACLILACIAATGLIGCGKTDETSKKFDSWFEKSDYRDMVVVNEYQKILPTDSVGL